MTAGSGPAGTAPTPASAWWLAIRPKTLTMAIVPVLTGAAAALSVTGSFALPQFLLALSAALAIQIGTNLFNDWRDAQTGLDTADRLGPTRVTASGLIAPDAVKRMAYAAFLYAAAAGALAVVIGGPAMAVIAATSILAGYCYSRGPWPISNSPFGEVFVLAFFGGVAVLGTYWLMVGTWSVAAIACGLQIGLPAAAVLLVNNHRDREGDAASGRRTLAILLGPDATRQLYRLFMVGACLFGIVVAVVTGSFGPLATLTALPLALSLSGAMAALPIGRDLNAILARTAQFQAVLGGLLVIGLLIGV